MSCLALPQGRGTFPLAGVRTFRIPIKAPTLVGAFLILAAWLPAQAWAATEIIGVQGKVEVLAQGTAAWISVKQTPWPLNNGDQLKTGDRSKCSIRFGDGSVGTLLYTSMGDARLAKESLEVFGEGRVARLTDYRTLELIANGTSKTSRSANQDKGFAEELRRFMAAVKSGAEMPIPFPQSVATTRTTLAALESLSTGLPQPI